MPEQRSTPNRRDVVRAHPLREALLGLIDRDGTTTSTVAARELGESTGSCSFHLRRLEALGLIEPVPGAVGRVKPWRRLRTEQATLNRELEDSAYATWLAAKTSDDEDFAFSEVVTLADGELAELRARLHRVLHDFIGSEPTSSSATTTTPTAVIIRAFPLHEQ
ncbi:winged helix-turn-helix domain-containing protein [Kribbella kalugense]|uniref:Helix-turn-helix protein n=1 Tax=Kribbella kalugense TaxID=2512221 RepID=A0A4R7ZYJ4_9ACTN|nr:helix-turn-helix domain-containing protein [Kribbella kalugense]TDW22846.1 helix-turn-helix protein [Kribbella kalugense]